MNNSEQMSELQRLRAELEALKRSRTEDDRGKGEQSSVSSVAQKLASGEASWNSQEIESKLKQVAALARDEAAERPLLTLVLVFALGVLFGRMLR